MRGARPLVIHYGAKTWPPAHGGVERIIYDLALHAPRDSVVLAESVQDPGDAGDPQVCTLVAARGLRGAYMQLTQLARANSNRQLVFHLHKETSIPLSLLLRLSGFRVILTLHGFGWRLRRWSLGARLALWTLDVIAYVGIRRVVFVGEHDYLAVRRFLPINGLRYVPNGVAVCEFSALANPKCGGDIVYLGRISPEKNILFLIRAMEGLHRRLDLYGPLDIRDDAFHGEFNKLLHSSKNTRWLGAIPADRVYEKLKLYKVLVNISFSEGLPVAVLEGAACGLKLVLSDIPQHRRLNFPVVEYVDPHQPVLVIPSGDGLRNRVHVSKHYSRQAMLEGYDKLYSEML